MAKRSAKQLKGRGRFVLRALVDLIGIASPSKGLKVPSDVSGKKILVFNWRDTRHAYAGGAEVYIHELSKRWVEGGNYVTMFCGSDGKGAPRNEVVDGVNVIRRGGFWFVYIWAFLYYTFRFRRKFDIIVDCHNGIPFFTPLFAREPVLCVVHHVHQEVFRKHLAPPLARFAMWLEAVLMPRAYNQAQYVTVSPSSQTEMIDLGITGQGIEIVYNGVDMTALKPGHKAKTPTVLYLGRLQEYKSVDVLIKSFRHVLADVPEAKLIIAGAGPHESDLRELVREERLSGAVTFAGRVSDEDKIRLMQQAWVSVNPSEMEGWGITTIESNACATPVIGADVPGLRDSIRHKETGYLVPHGDTVKLADHIVSVLKSPDLRRQVSERAHAWAQQFRWDVSADRMLHLMAEPAMRPNFHRVDNWNPASEHEA